VRHPSTRQRLRYQQSDREHADIYCNVRRRTGTTTVTVKGDFGCIIRHVTIQLDGNGPHQSSRWQPHRAKLERYAGRDRNQHDNLDAAERLKGAASLTQRVATGCDRHHSVPASISSTATLTLTAAASATAGAAT